jgi:hypothetical protein
MSDSEAAPSKNYKDYEASSKEESEKATPNIDEAKESKRSAGKNAMN